MFRNNTFFAVKMKNKFALIEAEIKYLLGDSHQHKLKDILHSHETIYEKLAQEELEEFDEKDLQVLQDIVAHIGVADVKEFGLSWEDFECFLVRLGYEIKVQVIPKV